ncbi:unnamed protein product [Musa acuminata subsp. malaccensis]|uniref:(wild Malaysian banana) hypothetical protein n=1 Tax=Musa acuminata subsp. malaccensis TaxID=214687 RepID=A0A804IX67_MUSAM|nr:unnamed protein product [Musa acuminata subsp. malaccensis]
MLVIFIEEQGNEMPAFSTWNSEVSDFPDRIAPWLGRWEGHSMTKHSGVYGATIAIKVVDMYLLDKRKHNIVLKALIFFSDDTTSTNNESGTAGTISNNLVVPFDGGFQLTLLPGGMYMGCPCDIGKNVVQSQSFHLELCWMESPEKRQKLVPTYDVEGLVVSSTYFYEIKVLRSTCMDHAAAYPWLHWIDSS